MSKPNVKVQRLLAQHTPQEIETLYRRTDRRTRQLGVLLLVVAMPVMVWVERWRIAHEDQLTTSMWVALGLLLTAFAAFIVRLYRTGHIENAYAQSRNRAANDAT